jgi:hypothetical protein
LITSEHDETTGDITKLTTTQWRIRSTDGRKTTYRFQNGVPVRLVEKKTMTVADRLYELLQRHQGLTKGKFETLAMKEQIPGATSHVIRDFLIDGIRFGKLYYENKKLTISPPKDKKANIEAELILEPDAE